MDMPLFEPFFTLILERLSQTVHYTTRVQIKLSISASLKDSTKRGAQHERY